MSRIRAMRRIEAIGRITTVPTPLDGHRLTSEPLVA
jgi:hypothetical protein